MLIIKFEDIIDSRLTGNEFSKFNLDKSYLDYISKLESAFMWNYELKFDTALELLYSHIPYVLVLKNKSFSVPVLGYGRNARYFTHNGKYFALEHKLVINKLVLMDTDCKQLLSPDLWCEWHVKTVGN